MIDDMQIKRRISIGNGFGFRDINEFVPFLPDTQRETSLKFSLSVVKCHICHKWHFRGDEGWTCLDSKCACLKHHGVKDVFKDDWEKISEMPIDWQTAFKGVFSE